MQTRRNNRIAGLGMIVAAALVSACGEGGDLQSVDSVAGSASPSESLVDVDNTASEEGVSTSSQGRFAAIPTLWQSALDIAEGASPSACCAEALTVIEDPAGRRLRLSAGSVEGIPFDDGSDVAAELVVQATDAHNASVLLLSPEGALTVDLWDPEGLAELQLTEWVDSGVFDREPAAVAQLIGGVITDRSDAYDSASWSEQSSIIEYSVDGRRLVVGSFAVADGMTADVAFGATGDGTAMSGDDPVLVSAGPTGAPSYVRFVRGGVAVALSGLPLEQLLEFVPATVAVDDRALSDGLAILTERALAQRQLDAVDVSGTEISAREGFDPNDLPILCAVGSTSRCAPSFAAPAIASLIVGDDWLVVAYRGGDELALSSSTGVDVVDSGKFVVVQAGALDAVQIVVDDPVLGSRQMTLQRPLDG